MYLQVVHMAGIKWEGMESDETREKEGKRDACPKDPHFTDFCVFQVIKK